MLKKHSILVGIIISIILLFIATKYYPGGSQADKNSIGFSWKNNYLCNLFDKKAMNGLDSPAQVWAIAGMFLLCISFALFFIQFSKKIAVKSAANIIKYFGVSAMAFGFLIATPYHDVMVIISSTLALVSIFYIAVFVFKSKLILFKITCIVCLLSFYCCNYMYYTRSYLSFLPIMQKVLFFIIVIWMLGLEYFTTSKDFEHINVGKKIVTKSAINLFL